MLEGKYDDLPEMAFYMVGDITEVQEKADKMAKEIAARKVGEVRLLCCEWTKCPFLFGSYGRTCLKRNRAGAERLHRKPGFIGTRQLIASQPLFVQHTACCKPSLLGGVAG